MVLWLYTSLNSPSHQSQAIFYLEDDVSIRVCQPLTAALWVVVLGESIVNQHNINRISLAGACTTLGQGEAVHQTTAHPEHTQEPAHRHTGSLSISFALFYSLSLLFLHTQTQKFTDLTKSDNRDRGKKKKTGFGQRECACQLFLTSFSVSSKVWGAHKVQLPIWQLFQSPNTEHGLFQRLEHNGSLPSMSLSSLTFSVDWACVSSQTLDLQISMASKNQNTSKSVLALWSILRFVRKPSLVTLLVLMRT